MRCLMFTSLLTHAFYIYLESRNSLDNIFGLNVFDINDLI